MTQKIVTKVDKLIASLNKQMEAKGKKDFIVKAGKHGYKINPKYLLNK